MFPGTFQYPLPKKKVEADRIGYCRNGIVFTMYHGRKQFAVKKVPFLITIICELFSMYYGKFPGDTL